MLITTTGQTGLTLGLSVRRITSTITGRVRGHRVVNRQPISTKRVLMFSRLNTRNNVRASENSIRKRLPITIRPLPQGNLSLSWVNRIRRVLPFTRDTSVVITQTTKCRHRLHVATRQSTHHHLLRHTVTTTNVRARQVALNTLHYDGTYDHPRPVNRIRNVFRLKVLNGVNTGTPTGLRDRQFFTHLKVRSGCISRKGSLPCFLLVMRVRLTFRRTIMWFAPFIHLTTRRNFGILVKASSNVTPSHLQRRRLPRRPVRTLHLLRVRRTLTVE